jgi:hypothetical protein
LAGVAVKRVGLILCGLIVLLSYSRVPAFWSIVGPTADHQDFTKAAIWNQEFLFGNQYYVFSQQAIDAINEANGLVDQIPYSTPDHFDGEQFSSGVQRMADRRAQLNMALSSSLQSGKAWQLLGFMLHAAQDFYAHSTWVELGKRTIVDFGSLTKNTSAPNLTSLQPATGTVCAAPAYPLTTPVTQLTSGYYDPNDQLGLIDPAPPGLCQHGTLAQAVATCASVLTPVHGISKDSPCGLYLQGPPDSHLVAGSLATKETLALVQSIVSDLNKANNAQGFCALLGLSPATTPICTSWAGTLQGALPLTGFTFACSPGPTCTINNVTFGVTIGQDGSVVTSPINDDGNWFITNCIACSPSGTFYDWILTSGTLTPCAPSAPSPCQSGSAVLQLNYSEGGAPQQPVTSPDASDYCNFTVVLTPGTTGITPTAEQGSICNYVGKGVQAVLSTNTGPPAVTFTPSSQ